VNIGLNAAKILTGSQDISILMIPKEQLMISIKKIEGIGNAYMKKLQEAGVGRVEDLLETGGTPSGRKSLAEKTGIQPELILTWVNHADLFRIRGVGEEYSDLLECAGVDTVVELAKRNPENLYQALIKMNAERKLVRRVPTMKQVAGWVEEAKSLPRKVSY
jgi:predicted flap endonuclease-1-like 5' DNA nuclease